MAESMILGGFQKEIDRETVFNKLQCFEDNPMYTELSGMYTELLPKVRDCAHMAAHVYFDSLEELQLEASLGKGNGVVAVFTLGSQVEDLSQSYFKSGEVLKGLMVDAMGDALIFQLDLQVQAKLKILCQQRDLGISRRCEVPMDIPLESQEILLKAGGAGQKLGIKLTNGGMFSPVKSMAVLFVLTHQSKEFHTCHQCSRCSFMERCTLRKADKIQVEVCQETGNRVCTGKQGQSLMDVLRETGVALQADCNGRGTCGKCKIIVVGEAPLTPEEKKVLSVVELQQGIRLACQMRPKGNCRVTLRNESMSLKSVEIQKHGMDIGRAMDETLKTMDQTRRYGLALDIGTTTLALSGVNLDTGSVEGTLTMVNSQKSYGADVVSRIQASMAGKDKALQECIHKDILEGIPRLLQEIKIEAEAVVQMVVSGNPTMVHLLMGYDCSPLAAYPFRGIHIEGLTLPFSELFASDLLSRCQVHLMPGSSAFIGGDIVAGVLYTQMAQRDRVSLLVDLGTNGEMVIGGKQRLLSTSVAAGPAFEGGQLSWGCAGVPGAICNAGVNRGGLWIETLNHQPPIGICGSGVLAITELMLKEGWMDNNGLFKGRYFEQGLYLGETRNHENITFSQQDMRQLQLAKGAVRAGIEMLMEAWGIQEDQMDTLYLAGGFGAALDPIKAGAIGLIPPGLVSKTKALGNSSLLGSIDYLLDETVREKAEKIGESMEELQLAKHPKFQEKYIQYMSFNI